MSIFEELKPMFDPKAIAVIGASRHPGSIGWSIFRDLVESKRLKSSVYPINPHAREILGHRAYPTVLELKDKIDLAVIAVPSNTVPLVMHDCVDKGVKTAVIITSGFSEIGGNRLELEVKNIAGENNIRVCGPNCLGIYDAHSGVDTLFLPTEKLKRPKQGNIALVSQSGAVGSVILDWVGYEGYGISKFISYGNAIDADESDFIEYLVQDDKTDVICLYLEGTKNGRRLMHVAKEAVKEKPVLIVKAGTSKEGTKAVSSHTGSLAGADEVYNAAFKQSGIIRTHDIETLFDYAQALSKQPLPNGRRILIITNGGGFGVLATDEVISRGMQLATLTDKSKKEIAKLLPPYAKVHNPLDLIGDADAKRYEGVLKIIEKDQSVDGILCVTLFQTVSLEPEITHILNRFNKRYDKPIVVCSGGGGYARKYMRDIEGHDLPVYDTPAKAADGLYALVKYSEIKRGVF